MHIEYLAAFTSGLNITNQIQPIYGLTRNYGFRQLALLMVAPLTLCCRAQSYQVTLPADLKCIDCSIRLIRQAEEWGSKYQFWSCSDVDILPPEDNPLQTCSGHGQAYNGRCRCKPLYYGDVCQYHNECREDKDCGLHGKCIDVRATTAPARPSLARITAA